MVWDMKDGTVKQTLMGHLGSVTFVAFSPDGQRIVSGSGDTTIMVWDVKDGTVKQTLTGHSDWIRSVAFSPDGQQIASGSYNKTIMMWDVKDGMVKQTLTGHSCLVISVAFSLDGRWIVSGSDDKTIRIWACINGRSSLTEKIKTTLFRRSRHRKLAPVVVSSSTSSMRSTSPLSRSDLNPGYEPLWREVHTIPTTEGVQPLKFSPDNCFLISNCGLFSVPDPSAPAVSTLSGGSKQYLHANRHWIYCDQKGIVRLPTGTEIVAFVHHMSQLYLGRSPLISPHHLTKLFAQ